MGALPAYLINAGGRAPYGGMVQARGACASRAAIRGHIALQNRDMAINKPGAWELHDQGGLERNRPSGFGVNHDAL